MPQIKEVLTAKLEGSRDIALKFKEAQTFERKQDFETGIAMLDEVSSMIENLSGGDDKGARDKLKAEWTKRVKTLAPQIKEVITRLENTLKNVEPKIELSVDEELNQVIVRILDKESGELIKQFPPEEVLELDRFFADQSGLLVEENV